MDELDLTAADGIADNRIRKSINDLFHLNFVF